MSPQIDPIEKYHLQAKNFQYASFFLPSFNFWAENHESVEIEGKQLVWSDRDQNNEKKAIGQNTLFLDENT